MLNTLLQRIILRNVDDTATYTYGTMAWLEIAGEELTISIKSLKLSDVKPDNRNSVRRAAPRMSSLRYYDRASRYVRSYILIPPFVPSERIRRQPLRYRLRFSRCYFPVINSPLRVRVQFYVHARASRKALSRAHALTRLYTRERADTHMLTPRFSSPFSQMNRTEVATSEAFRR